MAALRASESVTSDTFSLSEVQRLLRTLALSYARDAMNNREDMSGLLRAATTASKLAHDADEIRDTARFGPRRQ